ncbi:MAG: helix-turn-helix domain-containing protein [Lachnospiraceae bacterium]|nr:helix-turn-helix domain-containing protein [Lachnospiraceae bacterium]
MAGTSNKEEQTLQQDKNEKIEGCIVFGQNIKNAREKQNITKQKLAESIGYDRNSLSKLERGEKNVQYKTAVRLAEALDVPFPKLFSRNYVDGRDRQAEKSLSMPEHFVQDDYLMVYIENIRFKYLSQSLTQQDLASDSGLTKALVNMILHKENKNPTIDTLYKMAKAAGGSLEEMFSRASERENIDKQYLPQDD